MWSSACSVGPETAVPLKTTGGSVEQSEQGNRLLNDKRFGGAAGRGLSHSNQELKEFLRETFLVPAAPMLEPVPMLLPSYCPLPVQQLPSIRPLPGAPVV